MPRARHRLIVGLAVGLAAGLLGPRLAALSNESRNLLVQQDEVPGPVSGVAREDSFTNTFGAARASWSIAAEDGTWIEYRFVAARGAHHESTSDGWSYGAHLTEERRASAIVRICSPGTECKVRSWSGADTLLFGEAPSLARFAGSLTGEDGRPCDFDVRWTSPSGPAVTDGGWPEGRRPDHDLRARQTKAAGVPAKATLSSTCWGTLAEDGSTHASVYVEGTADAGASRIGG